MRANRAQVRSSKRYISLISNRLRRGLSTSLKGTIAAGIILLTCQNSVNAQLTILHSFGDGTVVNGGTGPGAGLIQAPNGMLFGVTDAQASAPTTRAGTIFRMTPSEKLVVIHSFSSTSNFSLGRLLYRKGDLFGISSGIFTRNLFALTNSGTAGWQLNNWFNFSPTTKLLFPSDLILVRRISLWNNAGWRAKCIRDSF